MAAPHFHVETEKMKDKAAQESFEHSAYSKIIGWYLLLNGLLALGLALWVALQWPQYANKITFGITSIAFPCASALLGYYLLIREPWAFRWTPLYLFAATPIVGAGTWQYTHAHGMSIHFEVGLFGLVLGINALPILGLLLLAKHGNLTNKSADSKTAAHFSDS